MGKTNSKSLGGAYERVVARKLSRWLTGSDDQDVFWRSRGSGSSATVSRNPSKAKGYAGDLMATDRVAHSFAQSFYIEIKRYGNIGLLPFVIKRSGFIHRVWVDTEKRAKQFDKIPLVVVKQPPWPPLIIMDNFGRNTLGVPTFRNVKTKTKLLSVKFLDCGLYLYDLDDLLEHTPPYL